MPAARRRLREAKVEPWNEFGRKSLGVSFSVWRLQASGMGLVASLISGRRLRCSRVVQLLTMSWGLLPMLGDFYRCSGNIILVVFVYSPRPLLSLA